MEQIKETVYLINDERYLHLRENGAGVGFATYNKVTGEPLESGQISEKNLPPDGQNTIPAARNWYLFELSDDDRKAIQPESVKILENIPQAGIGRRRIWEPETLPKDIRLINSHYDDLYRIPDGGVVQVDYPDGRSFTARLEHLDDYHFDMGGLGNVFHICQFAEVMERNCADFYPEIQTQDEQATWELGGKPPADARLRDVFEDLYAFLLDGLAVIVRKFKQIPVPGGRNGVPAIGRQVLFRDLPAFQRLTSYLVVGGKSDACAILSQMQVFVVIDEINSFFGLFHQQPPFSNSRENLLRPSASQDSSTVAL